MRAEAVGVFQVDNVEAPSKEPSLEHVDDRVVGTSIVLPLPLRITAT